MSETPGKSLFSVSDTDKQHVSKRGGYMSALFQLFDRNMKSGKNHSISKALPQPGKDSNDDKLPMAKLLLIADENRGGFPSPKKIAASKELSDRGTNSKFVENRVQKRAPGVVARLMGLESFPETKLSKDEDILKQIDQLELRSLQELSHHKQEPFLLRDQLHEGQAENIRRQSLMGKFSVFAGNPLDKMHDKQSQVITDGMLSKKLHMQNPLAPRLNMKGIKEPSDEDSNPFHLSSLNVTPLHIQSVCNPSKPHSKSNSSNESPNLLSNCKAALHRGGAKLVDPHVPQSSQFCVSAVEATPSKDSESETDSIRTMETLERRKRLKHNHTNLVANANKLLKNQPLSKTCNSKEDGNARIFHLKQNSQRMPKRRPFSPLPLESMESLPVIRPDRKNSYHGELGSMKDRRKPSHTKDFPRRYSADCFEVSKKQDAKKEDSGCAAIKKTAGMQVIISNQVGATMAGSSKPPYVSIGNAKHMQTLSSGGQDSLKQCKNLKEGLSTISSTKASLVRIRSVKGYLQQICLDGANTRPEEMATGFLVKPPHELVHQPSFQQEDAVLVEKRSTLMDVLDLPTEHRSQQEESGSSKTPVSAVNVKEKMQALTKFSVPCHSFKQLNLSSFNAEKNVSCNKHCAPGQVQRLTKRKQSTSADEDQKRGETSAVKSLSRRRVTPDPCVPTTKLSLATRNGKIQTESTLLEDRESCRPPVGTMLGGKGHAQKKPVKNGSKQQINMDQKLRSKRQLTSKKVIKTGAATSDPSKNKRIEPANLVQENMDTIHSKDIGSVVGTGITVKGENYKENVYSRCSQAPPALTFFKDLTKPGERKNNHADILSAELLESNKSTKVVKVLQELSLNSLSEGLSLAKSIESCGRTTWEDSADACKTGSPVTLFRSDQPPNACHSTVTCQEVSQLLSVEFTDEINATDKVLSPEFEGVSPNEFHSSKGRDFLDKSCHQLTPVSILDIPLQDESPKNLDESKREEVSSNEAPDNLQGKVSSNLSSVPRLRVRESDASCTNEDFIQSERIMEAILGISRIRHIDPCSLGIKEAIDMACAEDEVRYMHKILSSSKFLSEEKLMSWSLEQEMPIEAAIFEKVENQDNSPVCREYNSELSPSDDDDQGFISMLALKQLRGSFLQRKLLFDCLNEALSFKLHSLWNNDPLSGEVFLNPRLSRQKELIQEIHRQTCQWRELAGSVTDELVEKDMNSGLGKWADLKEEVMEVGLDVERMIFKMMMEDIITEIIKLQRVGEIL
ncbi:hypothetical protein O6H91_08G115700 [Diphasiastrum complanatum]|uniref:Uncharacterized protein n=2 Tax=Diphasiastrum complanatum TaxID=34168 RepID=A0ACC2D174_DIPCM|nr:hypothetical protein O6H91_08G115600 [Diphasiastrum complanatum]KAJ7548056.1 hypothetical protein O6H91_08G115700 [Diphasiastrum complanatum]